MACTPCPRSSCSESHRTTSMPDSDHEYLHGGGWEVFLAAFAKAAATT